RSGAEGHRSAMRLSDDAGCGLALVRFAILGARFAGCCLFTGGLDAMPVHAPSWGKPSRWRDEAMNPTELARVANAMVARGKGILAADESTGTIKKRFDTIKLESNPENHRAYRDLLFTTPGMAESISGVIMFDETIRQKTRDGVPFPQYLAKLGVIPGIKVDEGAKPLANFPGETITEGLDGLRQRLTEYRGLGARFAKWRGVIDISPTIPTPYGIEANAQALARYAALCQESDIVPIVEPEVLMDGDHTIERCEQVTSDVLESVFHALFEARVLLECMVLKPNMVIS